MDANESWNRGMADFWRHFKNFIDFLYKKDNQAESWKQLSAKQKKRIEELNKQ